MSARPPGHHRSLRRRAVSRPASRAEYYRRLRVAFGVRLRDVAKRTGFSYSLLEQVERGVRPLSREVEDALRAVLEREQTDAYLDAVRLEAA